MMRTDYNTSEHLDPQTLKRRRESWGCLGSKKSLFNAVFQLCNVELFCRKIYGKNYIEYYYQQIEEEWISRFSWEGEGSVQKGRSQSHSYCQARLVPRCQEQRVCRHLSTLSLNMNNIWLLLQDFFLQPKLVIQW